jgi:predicted TPR repeat methyltransferase
MKDTAFYNQESTRYSQKRYPKVAQTYTQFFFNQRLDLTKRFFKEIVLHEKKKLSVLELGCADGIIVRELSAAFPDSFSKLVGVDISLGMVEEAKRLNTLPNASFMLREEYKNQQPADIVNETGVINYAGFDADTAFASDNLKEEGYYILSVAGTGSLRNMLKHESDFADFRSYKEYEAILRKNFAIVAQVGCGVFIPLVWRLPTLARLIHLMIEPVVGSLMPGLCHEKLYLLKKK